MSLSAGVHSVLVTPFAADESLDELSLRTLVDYYVSAGVAGVLALGVLGSPTASASACKQRRWRPSPGGCR